MGTPRGAESLEKRYWAFISYSHTDTKTAEWLHKSLEGFKVPPSLVGTESRNGVVPRRIFPVFRDRDELPTSADLGANLHTALRNSRYLVVLCSPKSATSMWVNAEVEFFKKTHGNANVLCLIVDGVPGGGGEGEQAECFCPALRHQVSADGSYGELAEPIAADIRSGKDGRHRGFLKIIAGILGVDFDTLYQREKRHKRRRAILLAAACLAVAALGFAFYQRLDTVARSQEFIAGEVKKMRDSKYREFGKLPEERANLLEQLIADSGVAGAPKKLTDALAHEEKRFSWFERQVTEHAGARSKVLADFESFTEAVKPPKGWADAAKCLSRFSYFFALEEAQGRKKSMELMNHQFQTARQMRRVTADLGASLAGITAGINQAIEENHRQQAVAEGKTPPGSSAGQATPSEPKVAEAQPYSEEFAISAPFGERIDEASRLAARMKEVDGLLPAGWIIGNTEPKTDAYYRQSRAKSLGHAAWLLATAQDPRCRDPRQAVELAKEAAGLDAPNNVRALDTLAAACASAGDFESALRWQSLALRYAAESNPSEQEELLERYKLYEKHQPYVRDSGGGPDAEDTVFCIANQEGFDSWVLGQRDKLEKLALSLEEFSRTPEEKVVTQAELGKLREQQSQMELDGELALNKLRKNLAASTVASRAVSENEGYAPVGQMDGIATVSEKIWRKPADAPERGSLKTVASHPAWPGTKPKIDREGSVELYCIQRFLFPSPDGSSLDTDKMSVARGFSQASAQFLGLHLP